MADNLRDVLLDIRERRGMLTPAVVLQEASNPDHPLHTRFEWDDSVAAYKYRLSQAADLLRVTYRPDPDLPRDLRAFWVMKGVDGSPESQYVPTEEVLLDPIARQLMLNQMRREWRSFQRRYEGMAEFAQMLDQWRADQSA